MKIRKQREKKCMNEYLNSINRHEELVVRKFGNIENLLVWLLLEVQTVYL